MNLDQKSVAHREELLSNLTDCTLIVGQGKEKQQFKALKGLLAASSPVFAAMFFGPHAKTENMAESEVIEIPDVSPTAFQALLYHAYSLPDLADSKNWPSTEVALEILYAGHKYLFSDLVNTAVKYLKRNLSAETIFVVLHAATLCEIKELEDFCLNFFMENTTKCLEADQLLQTSLEQLRILFSCPEMNICSELELLRALERYVMANDLNRNEGSQYTKAKIDNVLKEIRFLSHDFEDFSQLIKWDLLTDQEKLAIGAHLSCPSTDYPLPSTINSNTRSRGGTKHQQWIKHMKKFFQKHGNKQIKSSFGCFGCKYQHRASTIIWDCNDFGGYYYPTMELDYAFGKAGIENNIQYAVESNNEELESALCKYLENRGVDVYKMFEISQRGPLINFFPNFSSPKWTLLIFGLSLLMIFGIDHYEGPR